MDIGPGDWVEAILGSTDNHDPKIGEACLVTKIEDNGEECGWGKEGMHICPGTAYWLAGKDNEPFGYCAACFRPFHGPELTHLLRKQEQPA